MNSRSKCAIAIAISVLLLFSGTNRTAARPVKASAARAPLVEKLPTFGADDFVIVSSPTYPRVAYALLHTDDHLHLSLEVSTYPGSKVEPTIGLATAKPIILQAKDARFTRGSNPKHFHFKIPANRLASKKEDWQKLRMAIAVRWTGGPGGVDRQRERFRHLDGAAPHVELSPNPANWMILDLDEYTSLIADRRNALNVPINQPMDGKLTVVIEDKDGRRIRNLVGGAAAAKGSMKVSWDGLDDDGKLVSVGNYRWRSISHPGIRPEYLMSFANGGERFTHPFGSNHMHFIAATAHPKYVFFAAPMTEGGFAMMAVDHQGNWKHGYNPAHGCGMSMVAMAADDKYLYVAHDGEAWGQHIKKNMPDWKDTVHISLSRFDIEQERIKDYPGSERFTKIEDHDWGPGSSNPVLRKGMSLGGMTLLNGKLFISSRNQNALLVIDVTSGKQTGKIDLKAPGALAVHGGLLYAVSGKSIVKIQPSTGNHKTLVAAGSADPQGITLDNSRNLYVSDAKSHTVLVYNASGKPVRRIGKPGGDYIGTYVPERMVNPRGLAVASGRLWVAESRKAPKRAMAWDLASNKVVLEKFGNPPYGGPNASFDDEDHTRWVGLGCTWKLDFATQTASCKSILGGSWQQTHYKFYRQNGRTYLIGLGGATTIGELRPDGTLHNLVFIGSTHRYSFQHHWNPPQVFIDAFNKAYPSRKGKHGDKGPGVLWVDKNGNGREDADEFEFSTRADDFAGGYWGHDFYDLTLRLTARVNGRTVIATLAPSGFYPSGAPRYPNLNQACARGVAVDLSGCQLETTTDRHGNLICNSDPWMKAFAPDGKLLWRYANQWSNVHGSHKAPLPEGGVLQGSLFFQGVVPLDKTTDVFVVNGNHGRFFVMTSDGLYLDEMFKDVRLGGSRDAYWVGGECFGGYFARSKADNNYYLQTGGDGYRIFRLDGLNKCVRNAGEITVTPQHLMAAERLLARKSVATSKAKEAGISMIRKPPTIDGSDKEWAKNATATWDRNGMFKVSVKCAADASNLYLFYSVNDDSPWVNNGKDWTTLFKTGDSIDLQIATDPNAPSHRRGPVPGDLRLLIAPYQGKPLAVLYKHRVPGAKNPVTFTCPWRSETVDVVQRLTNVRISVKKSGRDYKLEAAIPLSTLGLMPLGDCKADFGVIYGDTEGTINSLRSYWANQATGLVSDVPGEIMLAPHLWGKITFNGGN